MLNNDASRDNADFAPGDLYDARLELSSLFQGNGSFW